MLAFLLADAVASLDDVGSLGIPCGKRGVALERTGTTERVLVENHCCLQSAQQWVASLLAVGSAWSLRMEAKACVADLLSAGETRVKFESIVIRWFRGRLAQKRMLE
jgi:hypothetical protein